MNIEKKLKSRNFNAAITLNEGKFYTGFDGHIVFKQPVNTWTVGCVPNAEHVSMRMKLRHTTHQRGRSSAVFLWEDKKGFVYEMSMKGTSDLFKKVQDGDLSFVDGWLLADFIQTKQGRSYFVEVL